MKIVRLPVAALEVCDRVRVRVKRPKLKSEKVQEYAEAYQCGRITEPLDVFQERGTERYIVADGENRLFALRSANLGSVECRLHEGDELAALDFGIGCNQAHGLPRTKADKYHAFVRIMETALRDKYRTDTELSEKVGVSVRTINTYKAQWRDSEGGDRKEKRDAKKQAEKHTSQEPATCRLEPDSVADTKSYETEISDAPKPRKPREKKPELTPEQKKVAKEVSEAAKRDRLNEANRKTFVEGLEAIRSIPHDGAYAAKQWDDIDEDHVRYVLMWCDEFLREREKIGKAA